MKSKVNSDMVLRFIKRKCILMDYVFYNGLHYDNSKFRENFQKWDRLLQESGTLLQYRSLEDKVRDLILKPIVENREEYNRYAVEELGLDYASLVHKKSR